MKPLIDQDERELAATMRGAAHAVESALPPGTAFVLVAFDSVGPGTAQYVANCDRPSMIEAMRETAARLAAKEDVPR